MQARDSERRWLKRFGRREEPAGVRLLCFHHAGGSAAMFRRWPALLPDAVELVAVQLPGRADRFLEPAHNTMPPIVDELVEVIKPLLDQPFALYGVSMGARVAYALAHALQDRAMPLPVALYVASDPPPIHDNGNWPWQNHAGGLEGYVREMGGTPPEVLAQPELLRALLPTLSADLNVLSTLGPRPLTPLAVRIRAFAGTEDVTTTPEQMRGWEAETSLGFCLDLLASGHFFDEDVEGRVIRAIGADLT
jgi:medium-chain acyl-[acyl-carrier-protein] hydrolase